MCGSRGESEHLTARSIAALRYLIFFRRNALVSFGTYLRYITLASFNMATLDHDEEYEYEYGSETEVRCLHLTSVFPPLLIDVND